jgi:hypothetical protein
MRAFVRLRDVLAVHKDLARRLESLEKKFDTHDAQIKLVFETNLKILRVTLIELCVLCTTWKE